MTSTHNRHKCFPTWYGGYARIHARGNNFFSVGPNISRLFWNMCSAGNVFYGAPNLMWQSSSSCTTRTGHSCCTPPTHSANDPPCHTGNTSDAWDYTVKLYDQSCHNNGRWGESFFLVWAESPLWEPVNVVGVLRAAATPLHSLQLSPLTVRAVQLLQNWVCQVTLLDCIVANSTH